MTVPNSTSFLNPNLLASLSPTSETVTQALAKSPSSSVQEVVEKLYGKQHTHSHHTIAKEDSLGDGAHEDTGVSKMMHKLHIKKDHSGEDGPTGHKAKHENPAQAQWANMRALTSEQVAEVRKVGGFGGVDTSELFVNLFAQALITLEDNPLNGMVSPSLLGSVGVVPLSIISVIPDIIQHYADVITRAEHEVFLATNFWEASGAGGKICDAFRELSRRVVEGKREKVVIKLMYDRGNPSQVISPHQNVDVKTYIGDKIKLPHPDEMPGVTLQVQNYHVPPVGTFHAKYMVVDRKIALLSSNNIQDRVNVEMMTHIEGPIVQSFYDMALLSWYTTMESQLPLISRPPEYHSPLTQQSFVFGKDKPVVSSKGDLAAGARHSQKTLSDHHAIAEDRHTPSQKGAVNEDKERTWDTDNQAEANRVDVDYSASEAISKHLNTGTHIDATDLKPAQTPFRPVVLHSPHDPVPMAMVNRAPRGRIGHGDTFVPQDQAWLAGFKFAKHSVFVQTPTFNAVPVVEAALDAVRRGIIVEIYADLGFNDAGELLPMQGGTNQIVVTDMYGRLSESEKDRLRWYWYTGKDQAQPLNANDKSRNCHVKLMIVDGIVGVQGNGNQDSQSWFHSQEINVLVDSPIICKEWRAAIDANQNTLMHGRVDPKDGVWRDTNGKEMDVKERSKAPAGLGMLVGVKGAIQRVRGEGGF